MPTMNATPLRANPAIEQAVAQHEAAMNNSRQVPTLDDLGLLESATNPVVFVFNVGPWPHTRAMGDAGRYHIPACPDDKDYIPMNSKDIPGEIGLPASCPILYPFDETAFRAITPIEKGKHRAQQILGIGPHASGGDLTKLGVFMSEHNPPKKDEVAAAKKILLDTCQKLVREANEAYSLGPDKAKEVINTEFHFRAARMLKKTAAECRWLENTETPEDRALCPGCGEAYRIGIVRHSCGWIFSREKWEENQGIQRGKSGS